MGDAVVNLLLVRIRLGVALADALGHNARITLGVASVLAILALHAGRVLEEIAAEGAAHDVVKLVLDELVSVHLVHLLFPLTDGAFSAETHIDGASVLVMFDEAHLKLDLTGGLEVEPAVDGPDVDLRLWARGAELPPLLRLLSLATEAASVLPLSRAHRELGRRRARVVAHLVGRDPAGKVHLGLDPLTAHLLDDVGYSHPEKANGYRVLAGLVVHGDFDLVGLIHVDSMLLIIPAVGAGRLGARHDGVFDLDGDKRLGAAREVAGGGMVDALNAHDSNDESSAQGLSQVRRVYGVVWSVSVTIPHTERAG